VEVIIDLPGWAAQVQARCPTGSGQLACGMKRIYDQVDVLGFSWGGAMAQQFAAQHPRRRRRIGSGQHGDRNADDSWRAACADQDDRAPSFPGTGTLPHRSHPTCTAVAPAGDRMNCARCSTTSTRAGRCAGMRTGWPPASAGQPAVPEGDPAANLRDGRRRPDRSAGQRTLIGQPDPPRPSTRLSGWPPGIDHPGPATCFPVVTNFLAANPREPR